MLAPPGVSSLISVFVKATLNKSSRAAHPHPGLAISRRFDQHCLNVFVLPIGKATSLWPVSWSEHGAKKP